MASHLNMSLDQIIASKPPARRSGGGRMRVTNSGRKSRQVSPYAETRPGRSRPAAAGPTGGAALKFLLPNHLAGCLIGNGGASIKELMEICQASVHTSDGHTYYPATTDRVVYITGDQNQVNFAQSFVWEMIGQQTSCNSRVKWSPDLKSTGLHDDVLVVGKLTIPADMGGHLVGRAGSSLRHLTAESGATISIDDKAEADALQTCERVVTLEGTVASCMKCTSLILAKLCSQEGGCSYVCHGSSYPKHAHAAAAAVTGISTNSSHTHALTASRSTPRGGSSHRIVSTDLPAPRNCELLSANTTIEIAVPDAIINLLMGPHGSTLQEMNELSGAKILVSKRGEFIEGTTNRLVTVIGSPAHAQTAHTLILNKLKDN